MNLMSLTKFATPSLSKLALSLQKNSPELLLGAGIVGFVATNILSSRATLKLDDELETLREDILKLQNAASEIEFLNETTEASINYTKGDYQADLTKLYLKHSVRVAVLYAPTVVVGALSIAALIGSHNILKDRNVALMAAYQTMSTAYNKYRARVRAELGEEKDFEFANKIQPELKTNEKGVVTETPEVKERVVRDRMASPYARFYDETSSQWVRDANSNLTYLRAQQSYFNDRLVAKGHVFLNEVYDALGFDRTKAGQVVGWVIGSDGDNAIDFGIYDLDSPERRAFVNGLEKSILLDFNVDGVIYDKIEE